MSVCLSVCLFVPRDLANRCTNIVLLHGVASDRSWKGLLPTEIAPRKTPPPKKKYTKSLLRMCIGIFKLDLQTDRRIKLQK